MSKKEKVVVDADALQSAICALKRDGIKNESSTQLLLVQDLLANVAPFLDNKFTNKSTKDVIAVFTEALNTFAETLNSGNCLELPTDIGLVNTLLTHYIPHSRTTEIDNVLLIAAAKTILELKAEVLNNTRTIAMLSLTKQWGDA